MPEKAVVLLSGGVDSTTCLFTAIHAHGLSGVRALSLVYGQRHTKELEYAARTVRSLGIPHDVVELPSLKGGALTDHDVDVPDVSYAELEGVSPTYVPFRNGVFIAYAAAVALMNDAQYLYIGAHADDAAGDAYPDCTGPFVGAMNAAVHLGTYYKVRILSPLVDMTKSDVVRLGEQLGVPWQFTWSCYRGLEKHCGTCPTCRARKEAFSYAGVHDPTEYFE